jgi:hypothetical protein
MIAALLVTMSVADPPADAGVWRKVEAVKGFEGMRKEIHSLVDRDVDRKFKRAHVCMVVENSPGDSQIAWVHVREANWLYAFFPTERPPISDLNIDAAKSLGLLEEVVPTVDDLNGSIRSQPQSYVDRIFSGCAKYGDSFTVEKSVAPRR